MTRKLLNFILISCILAIIGLSKGALWTSVIFGILGAIFIFFIKWGIEISEEVNKEIEKKKSGKSKNYYTLIDIDFNKN